MPLIPELGRQRQVISELEANLLQFPGQTKLHSVTLPWKIKQNKSQKGGGERGGCCILP